VIDDPSRVDPGAAAPVLVFAWGNPSRGDDALGPLFSEAIEALRLPGVECLTDFQLQVEHALDLRGRRCVLFVDAATGLRPDEPFRVSRLGPRRDASLTTHAVSPETLLQVFLELDRRAPPPAWLLRIGGERWELGEALSVTAAGHLDHAVAWAARWLGDRREAANASGESGTGSGEARIGKPGPLPGGRVSGLT
jgi:hydrogenase maturation protease